MNARLALVSRDGEERRAYLDAVSKLGVQVDTVSSFAGLQKTLCSNPYHGVMVDLATKIAASKDEKALAHEILEIYPVVQLTLNAKTGAIKTLYYGQAKGSGTLEEFVRNQCQEFKARTIRSSVRKKVHLNLVLSTAHGSCDQDNGRTITVDVSKGGCFVYCVGDWEIGFNLSFVVKELRDSRPIVSEVRWGRPWGKATDIPGIGVKFEEIKENQLNELVDRFYL